MENSAIEWTDHTFNPWIGCTKISPGCDNCYAERWDRRFAVSGHAMRWGAGVQRTRTSAANWRQPLRWDAAAQRAGKRARVFCASLADVFDNEVPIEWLRDLCGLIELTPNLLWLLLTKRVGNVVGRVSEARSHDWLAGRANVMLGATVVTQAEADRDIPKLLAVPAARRFLSIEPMLAAIELDRWLTIHKHWKSADSLPAAPWHPPYPKHWYERQALVAAGWKHELHWIIVGGESGPNARPIHPDWVRSIRDQCVAAGVPFFFKPWGEWTPGENVERRRGVVDGAEFDGDRWLFSREDLAQEDGHRDDEPDLYRVGKKAAGRLLDGRTWDQAPT